MEFSPICTIIITLCWECTRKLKKNTIYHITETAENNKKIRRNKRKVSV